MSRDAPRVLFLVQGEWVPSSRFRVHQLVPRLVAAGLRCTVRPIRPRLRGETDGRWRPSQLFRGLSALRELDEHDLVFIQRPLLRSVSIALETIVARRRPTIFDMDDALFHNLWGLEGLQIRRIVQRVGHVIVGNQYLFRGVDRPEKTTVIPTVVDTARFAVRSDPGPAAPFTIGWTGLSSNLRELRLVLDPLRRVLRETKGRLLIVADRCDQPWLAGLPVDFHRWSPEREVAALATAHVGIMPLVDRPYNRGKCGFKLIQYMARGIPVIATPLGANREIVREGVDGYHAETADAWAEGLLTLAADRARREAMGAAGRQRVEAHYSLDAVVPRYLELLQRLSGGA
ncbi:MAG: glycosyltransferase family 4 protein [Proteobacteria bacterium]|nr:glycosyltransferase family 4 protein [Pseudomonadota bacterium]